MHKSDVQLHSDGYRQAYPAINVKVRTLGAYAADVVKRFQCDEKTAEKALEFAFESAREIFWERFQEEVQEIFGPSAKGYSAGRSGGWAEVHGLKDVESWNAVDLAKWSKLCKRVRESIADLTSAEQMLGDIEANNWAKPGAEKFNFIDTADGGTRCIADMKQEATAAGFGPVVRK